MEKYFIAFFGVDGSGKTTQACMLKRELGARGLKVKKVWIRAPHTVAYLLACFLIIIGFRRTVGNSFGKSRSIPRVDANRLMRFFWSITEVVGAIPVILLRALLPFHVGCTVIAERYVVDTIVSISYYTNDLHFIKSRLAKLLLLFIPKNSLLIKFDSDFRELKKRRGQRVESADFVSFQRSAYDTLAKLLGAVSIDTSNYSIDQTFDRVISLIPGIS